AERLSGTVRLAQERARHLAGDAEQRTPGRDPDQLDAEADAVAEQEEELVAAVVEARATLSGVLEERAGHERTLAAAERAHLAAVRALADRRAGLATLAGRAEAMRSTAAATADEIERLSEALAEAEERTAAAQAELDAAADAVDDGAGVPELEERVAAATEAHDASRARVAELVAREREAEQQRAHWRARVDALSVGLARRDGSAELVGAEGVLGPLPGLVTVEPWARTAVSAVLGDLADALAVDGPGSAVAALRLLRARDAGRAALVVAGGELQQSHFHATSLPESGFAATARWVAAGVVGDGAVADTVRGLLSGVVLVGSLDDARALVGADPALTAVTADGDVLGAARASGGSGTASSGLDVRAAVDDAEQARDGVESELARLRPALDGARAEEAARLADLDAARRAQAAAEQRRSAASAQLGRVEQAVRSATAEAQRLRERRDAVEARRSDALLALEAAEQQLAVAEDEPVDDEPDTEVRDAAADALETARSTEVDARLALRTAEERARAIAGRADSLRRQAA
ncbi:MAG: chromosome segregation protein SMC, partial [Pseudonocardiales bacterium]|nr:chromosome segregation protein SMC [Pseudonocardiales bacterium]